MIAWIKNLRSTEKGRVLFKFILYMIFFAFVVILVIVSNAIDTPRTYLESSSSREESKTEETLELTYFEKQKKLLEEKYEFTFKISGSKNIQYTGKKDEFGKIEGYKETEENLVRYSIENGKAYLIKLNEKTEYNELYEGLDEKLFDLESLFTKLNMTSSTIEKRENTKTYNYLDVEGKNIRVSTDKTSIQRIEVDDSSLIYELTFKY